MIAKDFIQINEIFYKPGTLLRLKLYFNLRMGILPIRMISARIEIKKNRPDYF